MRTKKIKPGSFVDRAIAKVSFNNYKQIDIKKLWNDEDTELDPDAVRRIGASAASD